VADIKLCDKCGGVFNPRGAWQSLTAVTFYVEDGRQQRVDSTLELCGPCSIAPNTESTPTLRGALGTGPQQIDAERDIWRNPDGTFHVRRGQQQIGPFSSEESAGNWVRGERNYGDVLNPIDGDDE
jgi:hypothetical protein